MTTRRYELLELANPNVDGFSGDESDPDYYDAHSGPYASAGPCLGRNPRTTEANRQYRLRRRLAAVARSGTPSGGLRFGIAEAPRPKPREMAGSSPPARASGADYMAVGLVSSELVSRCKSQIHRENAGKSAGIRLLGRG